MYRVDDSPNNQLAAGAYFLQEADGKLGDFRGREHHELIFIQARHSLQYLQQRDASRTLIFHCIYYGSAAAKGPAKLKAVIQF
jgi:hypothetical protein